LRARLITAMVSLDSHRSVEMPQVLRDRFEAYLAASGPAPA